MSTDIKKNPDSDPDSDNDADGPDINERMGRLAGFKRSGAQLPTSIQPAVKREPDSGSDSDSYDNGQRLATQRVERTKISRANAKTARAAAMQARLLTNTDGAPARTVSNRGGGGGGHPLPKMPLPQTHLIKVQDFLTQGELSVQALAEIERMYDPVFWDDKMEQVNPALYAPDAEEQNRVALLHQGVFENPLAFSLIKNMLTAHPKTKVSAQDMQTETAYLARIEPVPRAYVATMLREPRVTENPCCNGNGCLTYIWFNFVMVEFLTPMQIAQMSKVNGSRSSVIGPCLLCTRKTALYMRCMAIISGATNTENYIFQLHRNIVNRRGEYPYEYCLPVDGNVPYPIVMNMRSGYKHYKSADGRQWLTEEGYRMCTEEDEAQPVFCSGTPQPKTTEGQHQAPPPPPSQPPRRQ